MENIKKQLTSLLGTGKEEEIADLGQTELKLYIEQLIDKNTNSIESQLLEISKGEIKELKDLYGKKLGTEYYEPLTKMIENNILFKILKGLKENNE